MSDDVVEKIAKASTFNAMRRTPFANIDYMVYGKLLEQEKSFMRKGTLKSSFCSGA